MILEALSNLDLAAAIPQEGGEESPTYLGIALRAIFVENINRRSFLKLDDRCKRYQESCGQGLAGQFNPR